MLLKTLLLVAIVAGATADMLRKSIVFDVLTPDVFYCPVDKIVTADRMFVVARPLKSLCEYKGGKLPADYKSDCYNDVDESEYACKEKKRITMRMDDTEMEEERRNIHPNSI